MSDIQVSKSQPQASWLGAPPRISGSEDFSASSAEHAWQIGAAILLLPASGVTAAWLLEHDGYVAALFLSLAGFVIATAFIIRGWQIDRQMRRELTKMQRRYQDMYGRAGISIWQEDWTAVGDAIRNLRAQGVDDIVGWYRDHPEEARALHARVLVTDVNAHSCYLMRANSPADLIGSLADVLPGSIATFPRWLAAFCSEDRIYIGESRLRRLDGDMFDCFVTAAIPADEEGYREIIVSTLDITGYRRDSQRLAEAREELGRVQRIVTAGMLTATIAHEVNSPLAAVSTNAAACVRWLERDPPVLHEARDAAQAALAEIERAQAVISHAKSYFSRSKNTPVDTDLRKLISETMVLIGSEASRHEVELSVKLASDLALSCDPIQIQQALVNLCVNAIQAMGDSKNRRLLLVQATREERGIVITVEDTGAGIDEERLGQIFDPFYSTKEGGMGMGLAISRSCVEAHRGWISVRTASGKGTRFEIVFPVVS